MCSRWVNRKFTEVAGIYFTIHRIPIQYSMSFNRVQGSVEMFSHSDRWRIGSIWVNRKFVDSPGIYLVNTPYSENEELTRLLHTTRLKTTSKDFIYTFIHFLIEMCIPPYVWLKHVRVEVGVNWLDRKCFLAGRIQWYWGVGRIVKVFQRKMFHHSARCDIWRTWVNSKSAEGTRNLFTWWYSVSR